MLWIGDSVLARIAVESQVIEVKWMVSLRVALLDVSVLDLQDGEVAEVGSHPVLIQRQGLYADMWARQQEAGSASAPSSRATSAADLQSRTLQQSPLSRETK